MTPVTLDPNLEQAIALLEHYSFDLSGFSATSLVYSWQQHATSTWIRDAVIEALYQGRYKAVSVGQVLLMWSRRGQPLRHFTIDFNRMVCSPLDPRLSAGLSAANTDTTKAFQADSSGSNPPAVNSDRAIDHGAAEASPVQPAKGNDSLTRFKQLASPSKVNTPVLPLSTTHSPSHPKPISQTERLREAIAAADATDPKTINWPMGDTDERSVTPPNEPPLATHQMSQLLASSSPLQPQEPIRQFVPPRQGSVFYSKLKSVTLPSKGENA
ncbi:MAG: hypothetical protein AAFX95_21355 [Cyanobacteria bacterium J06639_16]